MGLLDALKQYWQDASPGGALNPEIPRDTPVLGLLADPMGSIRSTLNKANAQADAHLKKLDAASRETAKTGKWTGPAQQAYQGELGNFMLNTFGPLQTVWHGSPHKFDKFDASKIGTGEGAQAYGHGLYLAESKDVAKGYAADPKSSDPKQFFAPRSNATQGAIDYFQAMLKGEVPRDVKNGVAVSDDYIKSQISQLNDELPSLYKVDLPDEAIAKMLNLDAPIEQAPMAVQDYYKRVGAYKPGLPLSEHMAIDKSAATEFSNAGIPGIRYLDGGSRGVPQQSYKIVSKSGGFESPLVDDLSKAQEQLTGYRANVFPDAEIVPQKNNLSSNFVIFPGNEGLLTILERNGQPLGQGLLK